MNSEENQEKSLGEYLFMNECNILIKIDNFHQGKQKNIVRITDKVLEGEKPYLVFEVIKGESLEYILEQNTLSTDKILKYSADISNGLAEMYAAGVWYHRDIRPANIIIDYNKDRAVIIDFAFATTNKNAVQIANARFGAPNINDLPANDFISLGQVMYYMATGEHVFLEAKNHSRNFIKEKNQIQEFRNKLYGGLLDCNLDDYLKKVDKKIWNKDVRVLVKMFLKSTNIFYHNVLSCYKTQH